MLVGRLFAAGLVGAAFSSLGTGDELAFGPTDGASVQKRFEIEADFELDDMSAMVDGQDLGAMLALTLSMETVTTVAVSDEYVAVANGRPTQLRRTFDTIGSEMSLSLGMAFGDENQDMTSESELEGATVVFRWDEDEGAYAVEFDDMEGDQDLLDGLEEEMDLRFLLPGEEVAEEDTWEVDVKELLAIASPGGNLSLIPEDIGGEEFGDFDDFEVFDELFEDGFADMLDDFIEGTCVCTYAGTRDVDGTRVGEIRIAVEVTASADLADLIEDIMEAVSEQLGEEIPVVIEMADLNLDLVGEGVLLWNLAAGRVHSLDMTSEAQIAMDLGITADEGGQEHSAELSIEMSGSQTHTLTTEE